MFGWADVWSDGTYKFVWNSMDDETCGADDKCIATHYSDSNHFKDYYAEFLFKKYLARPNSIFNN